MDYQFPADSYVLIGKVTKVHGLKGEVKIFCYSGEPEALANYGRVTMVNRQGQLANDYGVERSRPQGKLAIVKLTGVDSRNNAEEFLDAGVLVAKRDLPPVAEGEYYWFEYQGKLAVDMEGRELGLVDGLFHNGAQDVLVIARGKEELLIPVTSQTIRQVTAEQLILDPPPGLLEINTGS